MGDWRIKQAARAVQAGGIIAYPTEAVYGLGCNPYDAQAVLRLLAIKRRDPAQGLILIGSALSDFSDFIQPLDKAIEDKVMASWPGPYTWLLPTSEHCPVWLRGVHQSIAVRITAHAQCRKLCELSGMALVSTSANLHGKPAAITTLQVRQRLGDELDYILAGQVSGNRQPSEIRDALTDQRVR